MYFINGMFWQQGKMPFIGNAPGIGEVLMIGERQLEAVFSGLIGERSLAGGNDGYLQDIFGKSVLTNFQMQGSAMSFLKQYLHRLGNDDFLIEYTFTKQPNGIWAGTWQAPSVGKGNTRCILTEIPGNFFTK